MALAERYLECSGGPLDGAKIPETFVAGKAERNWAFKTVRLPMHRRKAGFEINSGKPESVWAFVDKEGAAESFATYAVGNDGLTYSLTK